MRRILRAVNVGRVNSVRLGDALHSLTLTEISLLPFGGAQHVGHVASDRCSIKKLRSLLSANSGPMRLLIEEIRLLEARIGQLERELTQLARQSPVCTTLLSVPGIGLLTATPWWRPTGGQVNHFRNARHFASWFGLTPKESSSGMTRRLGRISKRGAHVAHARRAQCAARRYASSATRSTADFISRRVSFDARAKRALRVGRSRV